MSDPNDDERIASETPAPEPAGPAEVVSSGRSPFAFGAGRRPGGAPGIGGGRSRGSLVRLGLVLLATLGAVTLYFGGSTAADPGQARCNQARVILEDEDDDLEADDIECDDAIGRANQVEDEEVSSESAVRTTGYIVAAIGLAQLVSGILTLRTRSKTTRILALVASALGIVFPVLGFVSMAVLLFVVFAIFFSADARATFGEPRFLRPRAR